MQLVQQRILEALQNLSPLEQQEVLDFAEFLGSKRETQEKLRVHSDRGNLVNHRATFEQQLTEMANDPAIQAELRAINQEFAATEMDGLGTFFKVVDRRLTQINAEEAIEEATSPDCS